MLRTPTFVSAMRRHVRYLALLLCLPAFTSANDLGISFISTQSSNTVTTDVVVTNFDAILSMQFAMKWDPSELEFVSVNDFALPNMANTLNFGLTKVAEGFLYYSWLEPSATNGFTLSDCSAIFRITFNSINGQMPPVTIDPNAMVVEIYNAQDQEIPLVVLPACDGQSRVSGLIYNDTNENCQMDGEEIGMSDCKVKVERNGQTQYVTANNKGEYYFLGPAGDYTLSAILPENVQLLPCEPTVNLSVGANELVELLFGANPTGGNAVSATGESAQSNLLLQASPNPLPTGHALTVTTEGPADLRLYDVTGKLVRQWAHVGTGEVALPLQGGAYFLKATAKDGSSQTIKLVVN